MQENNSVEQSSSAKDKKNSRFNVLRLFGGVIVILIFAFLAIPPAIVYQGKYHIYTSVDNAYPYDIGIVFGAGVRPDKTPSPMLEDRLRASIDLYNEGKIKTILVSGDNSEEHYNEPQAMYEYLVKNDIPAEDIERDFAGRRTYDTCYRAKEIFGVDQAILITQGYHLPRALYLCNTLGITSAGYSATMRKYANEDYYKLREVLALYKSVLDINILHPAPILGDKMPLDLQ